MAETIQTQCCITGGGPAGMMLGFLLARAGVDVVVLEKHKDFLRDFRGDTVHPSTLEIMHELGLLEKFLKQPHQKVRTLTAMVSGQPVTVADFTHLSVTCPYVALMPQWDFLNFIASEAKRYPGFHLHMEAEVTGLTESSERVTGVKVKTKDGELLVQSTLVVGADGRRSTVRDAAGLKVENMGAPIDVLWFRLSRRDGDPEQTAGNFDAGKIMVTLNRGDYWQCAYVIPKGAAKEMQQKDIQVLRDDVISIVPYLKDRVAEIKNWDDAKLLTVTVDRLTQWSKPGLLCIGDAAHAMSPVGGVGINLAVQDAVATARILAAPLREKRLTDDDLKAVQARREWPMKVIQRLQIMVQDGIISKVLKSHESFGLPLPLKLLKHFPILRRIPAYIVGLGIRREHVA